MCLSLGLAACSSTARNDTFDLTSSGIAEGPTVRNRQLLVPEPTALKALDSSSILVRLSGTEIQYLARAQWSDRLPRMVQSKLVEGFENSGRLAGVGQPGQGLAIDYQLVSEIRSFEIVSAGTRSADVEISVKILNDRNGTVQAQRSFKASEPVSGSDNRVYVRALDRAFSRVNAEIVEWTLRTL
ncbi:ABC-type transport auxiliary lipoprotein family protein [Rhizobiaceae bacterium BDR2-2]|uniref:ABC-type transport auxiliary lipoprotein family protein n=2 Tax=Ectorhizobium quercum TaxID=2965071 RepID=A0AAE3MZW7_9HYPH|nr:ABC-type transport auxiliary lipoprotein family protein [Ectorhizobium quercum]MCX8997536.1 ABC-type transport auxiliary lipoprotein family protein [Ectorhizobium quercum]